MVESVQSIPLAGSLPGDVNAARRGLTSDFVVGPENRLVAQAIDSLLNDTASSYSPLVLCGPPGSGKSHLARGLAEAWKRRHGEGVVVIAAVDFARDYAAAIEHDRTSAWRQTLRQASLLVLEDLSHLNSKRAAQQELIFVLDELADNGGRVVVTSSLSPTKMTSLLPALSSRLTGGLVIPLALPGPAARRALVERLAVGRMMTLDDAAVSQLTDALAGAVPELHAALCELQMIIAPDGQAIDGPQVRAFFSARTGRPQPTLRGITSVTAKYFGLKTSELTSASRRRGVVTARGIAMYLARQMTGKSLQQLGVHFGGRDHTTVLHSYRNTDERLRHDPEVRCAVSDLRQMLALY